MLHRLGRTNMALWEKIENRKSIESEYGEVHQEPWFAMWRDRGAAGPAAAAGDESEPKTGVCRNVEVGVRW